MTDYVKIRKHNMRFTSCAAREKSPIILAKDERLGIKIEEERAPSAVDVELRTGLAINYADELVGRFAVRERLIWFLEDLIDYIKEDSWVLISTKFEGKEELIRIRDKKLHYALIPFGTPIEEAELSPLPIPDSER